MINFTWFTDRGEQPEAILHIASKLTQEMEFAEHNENVSWEEAGYQTYRVRKGVKLLEDSITIEKVTQTMVTIRTAYEFYARSYRDGTFMKDYGIGERFSFNKGELLTLDDVGLTDASYTIKIFSEE